MLKKFVGTFLMFLLTLSLVPVFAYAESFQCEVMSLEGSAYVSSSKLPRRPLKEGDIVSIGDTVEVDANSYVDLGYDKNWKNVTRVEAESKIEIKSLFPTSIKMDRGGLYAQLKELPKESMFEVQTPTAIAAVRGTEYRTVYDDNGTQVYNFSNSQVYVFGEDEDGNLNETPTIVENAQMTEIEAPGLPPVAPRPMFEAEQQKGRQFRGEVQKRIQENVNRGRVGKIHDIGAIERIHRERLKMGPGDGSRLSSTESGEVKGGKIRKMIVRENKMLKLMNRSPKSGAPPKGPEKQPGRKLVPPPRSRQS